MASCHRRFRMDSAAPDGVRRRPPVGQTSGWMALALVAAFSPALAQQGERRDESAAVPVRYAEGTVHGFLELRTATGTLLANGDLLQVPRDREIQSRMVFHFSDASVFEEAVTFTQHGVFTIRTEKRRNTPGGSTCRRTSTTEWSSRSRKT
jgi:hypothetical protein